MPFLSNTGPRTSLKTHKETHGPSAYEVTVWRGNWSSPLTSEFSFSQQVRFLYWCLRWGQTSSWSTPYWGPEKEQRVNVYKRYRSTGGLPSSSNRTADGACYIMAAVFHNCLPKHTEALHSVASLAAGLCTWTYIGVSSPLLLLPQLHSHTFTLPAETLDTSSERAFAVLTQQSLPVSWL